MFRVHDPVCILMHSANVSEVKDGFPNHVEKPNLCDIDNVSLRVLKTPLVEMEACSSDA